MRFFHITLALLVVLIWGFNFVPIIVGLQGIPPILLGFARFFLTSIPAIFFIKKPQAPFKMIILYGLIMFALQFALLFMGMYLGVTPGLASLLLQSQVFFTLIMAGLFLREKLHFWQIIGALVALLGIVLVFAHLGGDLPLSGFVMILMAALSWGVGNIISKKMGEVNMVSLVVWGSLIAWPPLFLISLFFEGFDTIVSSFSHLTWLSGGAVFYITYLATLFCFCIWGWLLNHYSLAKIAPFPLLVPVVGLFSSVIVFDEPLQSWKIFAALLIILGLCINIVGTHLSVKKSIS